MATATKKKPEQLVEVVENLRPLATRKIDAENGVIEGVKLLGFHSKNGRYYPPEVVRAAVPLYEGVKVNVDHPPSPSAPRGYKDRMGVMRQARFVEGEGIFADYHFNPKHNLAPQLCWDAKNNPEVVGFSHNALSRIGGKDSQGREVVEQIVRVRHVDLVADPATTSSLFESEYPQMDPSSPAPAAPSGSSDPLEMIVDSIASKIGEIAKAEGDPKAKMKQIADLLKKQDKIMSLLAEPKADGQESPSAEHVALDRRIAQLTSMLEQYQAKERQQALQATIEQELTAAGLDKQNPIHVSELFSKTLFATESVDARKALIADRVALVKPAAGGSHQFQTPKSGSTFQNTSEQLDAKSFARRLLS